MLLRYLLAVMTVGYRQRGGATTKTNITTEAQRNRAATKNKYNHGGAEARRLLGEILGLGQQKQDLRRKGKEEAEEFTALGYRIQVTGYSRYKRQKQKPMRRGKAGGR